MSKREKLVKKIYSFFSIAGDVFSFYISTIGVLTLYAFSIEIKLMEVLNLTMIYPFYLALASVYIIIRGCQSLLFLQLAKSFEWIICSLISFTYLFFAANDPYKLMSGFIACYVMKMLIVAYVKIRKYSTECIGISNYKIDVT